MAFEQKFKFDKHNANSAHEKFQSSALATVILCNDASQCPVSLLYELVRTFHVFTLYI